MFVATINVPGYLPMDDEPPTFDMAREAWWHLYRERCDADWEDVELPAEGHDHNPYTLCPVCSEVEDSETADELGRMAELGEVGTVYGPTPGYRGDHDLGLAYCVTEIEDAKCGPVASTWFGAGLWPTCQCGFDPHDNRLLTEHWAASGFRVVDDHGTLNILPINTENKD